MMADAHDTELGRKSCKGHFQLIGTFQKAWKNATIIEKMYDIEAQLGKPNGPWNIYIRGNPQNGAPE